MENNKVVIDLASMDSVMENLSVKKKDIKNPEIIEGLQFLCKNGRTIEEILKHRIIMLEGVCEIYIEQNQDDLFEVSVEEIDIIKEILG